ncbi:MAG: BspA family leucine-rich repeat surface protein, partial [Bacteroidota bacterium]
MTGMFSMFNGARSFNGDLSGWDVSNVSNMDQMFRGATAFNSDISNWDVSNLESAKEMFRETRAFNADISRWNTENLLNADRMFFSTPVFDRSLGDWDIGNLRSMDEMLRSSGLSTLSYDRTLIGWSSQVVKQEVVLGANGVKFCAGEEARDELSGEFGWVITDGGSDCSEGNGTDILQFTVAEQISPAIFDDVNKTINITVSGGSNIVALTPTISLSRGATSSPASEEAVDFSQSVVYSVTSEDGTTSQDWVVTVTEAANTETDILTFLVDEVTGPVFINTDNHVVALKVATGTDLT